MRQRHSFEPRGWGSDHCSAAEWISVGAPTLIMGGTPPAGTFVGIPITTLYGTWSEFANHHVHLEIRLKKAFSNRRRSNTATAIRSLLSALISRMLTPRRPGDQSVVLNFPLEPVRGVFHGLAETDIEVEVKRNALSLDQLFQERLETVGLGQIIDRPCSGSGKDFLVADCPVRQIKCGFTGQIGTGKVTKKYRFSTHSSALL
jgi:hypothetical protein